MINKTWNLCDAHTHFSSEEDLNVRIEHNILSLCSHSTPDELDTFLNKGLPVFLIPTYGIHPWKADQFNVKEMESLFLKVPIIGEIGMDNVWCDVPLSIQKKVFEEQLELASALQKPVILHTKGQEKEIAKLIRNYPNRYLVHWYSCDKYLEEYMEQDCYFSIGPDVWWNSATRHVAETVPLNRLLIETDGLSAVQWAFEEAPTTKKAIINQIPNTAYTALELVIQTIARLRTLTTEECSLFTYENLKNGFLKS